MEEVGFEDGFEGSLRVLGSAFQRVGAAKAKALSAQVRYLVLGTTRRSATPDSREREGTRVLEARRGMGGVRLFGSTLKWILCLTGSQ